MSAVSQIVRLITEMEDEIKDLKANAEMDKETIEDLNGQVNDLSAELEDTQYELSELQMHTYGK